MMRLGILGGTFDPPHLAHLIAGERAVEDFALDQLLFVPTHIPPHKPEQLLSSTSDRLAMTRLAIQGNPKFDVSEIELSRPGISYSIDTIRLMKLARNATSIVFFIGSDQFATFETWRDPNGILREAEVVVMARPLDEPMIQSPYENRVNFMTIPLLQISSTDIRELVRDGKSIRYMVPDVVRAYIVERGLYLQ